MRKLMIVTILIGVAAWASDNVIVNGGFESGQLSPWVPSTVGQWKAGQGGYEGNYCGAGYGLHPGSEYEEGYMTQTLPRTYYPEEFEKVTLAYWGQIHYLGAARSTETYVGLVLGNNPGSCGGPASTDWRYDENDWQILDYPFNFVKVSFLTVGSWYDIEPLAAVDKIQLFISTDTRVSPTSLGRVKAMFR